MADDAAITPKSGAITVQRERRSEALLGELARLRVEVFRAWPYLYAGSADYEARYLSDFLADESATMVVARHDGQAIGMATASRLAAQPDEIQQPLRAGQYNPALVHYFGESVLLPRYRGCGIGHRFFDERERAAREANATHACFCAVVREDDHPARPAAGRDLSSFWRSRGYVPAAGMEASIAWREVGASVEVLHRMQFWIRRL